MQKFNLIARVLSSDTHVHKRKSVLMSRLLMTVAVLWCGLSSLSAVAQGADTLRLSASYNSGIWVADTTFNYLHSVKIPSYLNTNGSDSLSNALVTFYGISDSITVAYELSPNAGRLSAATIDTNQSIIIIGLRVASSDNHAFQIQLPINAVFGIDDACSQAPLSSNEMVCNGRFEQLNLGSNTCANTFPSNSAGMINASNKWYNGGEQNGFVGGGSTTSADLFVDCNENGTVDNTSYPGLFSTLTFPNTTPGNRAYGGIYSDPNFSGAPYHEYISQNLSDPLVAGDIYYVAFSARRGNNSGGVSLGLSIRPNNQTTSGLPTTSSSTAVISPSNVTATNWTKIFGLYKATGEEGGTANGAGLAPRIDIGCFQTNPTSGTRAYYFIDSVTIFRLPLPATYCSYPGHNVIGEEIPFNIEGATIQWFRKANDGSTNLTTLDGENGLTLTLPTSGFSSRIYVRRITIDGQVYESSTIVTVPTSYTGNLQISSNPIGLCPGASVVLSASNPNNLQNIWVWTFNGTIIPNATSSSVTANQLGGVYKVYRTNDCRQASYTLGLPPIPPQEVNINCGSSIQIGNNTPCSLTDMTVSWSPTTGLSSPSALAPYAYPTQTTVYIRTITHTPTGVTSVSQVTVNVLPTNTDITAPTNTICIGNQVLLTVNGGPNNATYKWTVPILAGGNMNVMGGATYNATVPGTYLAQLQGTCSSFAVFDLLPITITGQIGILNETTDQNYAANEEILICPDNVLKLTGMTDGVDATYSWSVTGVSPLNFVLSSSSGKNVGISFKNKTLITPTITLVVTDKLGCTKTVSRTITVLGCCVDNALIIGKLNETTTYTDALPPSPSGKYMIIGDIILNTSTSGGTFLIADKDIYVSGIYEYHPAPEYGGKVLGPKITVAQAVKLNIKGSNIQAVCDVMWDGLYIDKGASLVLEPIITTVIGPEPTPPDGVESTPPAGSTTTTKRSLFADSYNGIVELGSAVASQISYTDFRNNFISWKTTASGGSAANCTFSSDPNQMKKPLDAEHNNDVDPNIKGYYYAHSFIRVSGAGKISAYGNNFNGALYGIEFLNAPNLPITNPSFIGTTAAVTGSKGNTFSNFFIAGIYAFNDPTTPHTVRPYDCVFDFTPNGGNTLTAQIKTEKHNKAMSDDAMYGIYANGARINMPNGLVRFLSNSNVAEYVVEGDRWQHKYNHIGIYANNSNYVYIDNANGSSGYQFTKLKTAVQLEGDLGNNYTINKSLFANCQTGILVNRNDKSTLYFQFACNEFLKMDGGKYKFPNHNEYDFVGVELNGHSPINNELTNQLGGCTFVAGSKVSTTSPQGNEVKANELNPTGTGMNTTVPNKFTFIRNRRKTFADPNVLIPLTYRKFGNENVQEVPSSGITIEACDNNGVPVNADINACFRTAYGILSREGQNEEMPQVINRKATLYQNAPNPFGYNTAIRYAVPADTEMNTSDLQLVVIEPVSGKIIRQIALKDLAGIIELSTEGLASGMYVYALTSNGSVLATKKMVVTR